MRSKILSDPNVQLLINKFDLQMPDPKYKLKIVDYEVSPEGCLVINTVHIYKNGEFFREADIGKLFDHLPDYEIKFNNLSEVVDETGN